MFIFIRDRGFPIPAELWSKHMTDYTGLSAKHDTARRLYGIHSVFLLTSKVPRAAVNRFCSSQIQLPCH